MSVNKEKLQQFLNHSSETLEEVRKRMIAALETSEKTSGISQNPLYESYLEKCQKRGLQGDIPTTVMQQQALLANNREFLKPSISTNTKPRF